MDAKTPLAVDDRQTVPTGLEYVLVGDLRDLLEEPETQVTHQWMQVILDALIETLTHDFEPDYDDEYLSVVLENHPGWSPRVAQLREERAQLYFRLLELRNRIESGCDYAAIARSLRRDLREWMSSLESYHRQQNRLIHMAVSLDVGGSD